MGWVTEDAVFLEAAIFIRRPTVLFDVAFNEPGVYFVNDSGIYVTSVTFSEPVEINTVKTLDNKYLDFIESSSSKIKKEYLPDDIGGSVNPDTLKFKSIILESSTEGSSKRFKITIDDTGTLSVEELGG